MNVYKNSYFLCTKLQKWNLDRDLFFLLNIVTSISFPFLSITFILYIFAYLNFPEIHYHTTLITNIYEYLITFKIFKHDILSRKLRDNNLP